MVAPLTLAGGALLGLASSLHCVGMCGGIAIALSLPARDARSGPLIAHLAALHGGRALSYMALGGVAGMLGGAMVGLLDATTGHLLLRWAAAMALAWAGLAMVGLMPSPAFVGHALLPRGLGFMPSSPNGQRLAGLAAGLGWGLLPCGMVYSALLYATFTGSLLGGILVMAGFALGTLPALLATHGGSLWLTRIARGPQARWSAGLALCLIALLSLLPADHGLIAACRSMIGL